MEEVESVTERLEEEMHEIAEHAKANWLRWSALMSAIFAVLATIAGLQSGHAANEAMLRQIEASNEWNYYQAKGIKAMIAEQQPSEAMQKKVDKYHEEQEKIKEKASELTADSKIELHKHEVLARAVALFQVAIAITAISVMTKRRAFLLFALALGVLGSAFFVQGWLV